MSKQGEINRKKQCGSGKVGQPCRHQGQQKLVGLSAGQRIVSSSWTVSSCPAVR